MMPPFKRQLRRDLAEVFFNFEEFGEVVELAGRHVRCVYEPLPLEQDSGEDRLAVAYEGVTVYVAYADMPDRLLPGREVSFRHQKWFVLNANTGEAMRTIQLYRERT